MNISYLKTATSSVLVFCALSFIYTYEIQPNWGYVGFQYEFNGPALIVSFIALLAVSSFISSKLDTRSFFITLAVYISLIPALVFFTFAGASILHIGAVLLSLFVMMFFSQLEIPRLRYKEFSKRALLFGMIGATALMVGALIAFGGLASFNLDLSAVYDFRRTTAANLPSIFAYLISPVSKVIIPVGLVLGVYYHSKTTIVLFVILTVIFFGLTHHKSILFLPVAVFALFLAIRRWENLSIVFFLVFGAASIALIEYFVFSRLLDQTEPNAFSNLIIRRIFFIPTLLDSFYVEFFSENEKYFWAPSKISLGLVRTDYEVTAPFLIGDLFFGRLDMSANSGIVASGYANAGLLGVVAYSIIVGAIISVLNTHGRHLGHAFVISISSVTVATVLTTSDLVTVMLTHGLLLMLLLLSGFPRSRDQVAVEQGR